MAETKTIEDALLEVQKVLKNPKHDKENPHFHSKYVSLARLLEEGKQALNANGLRLSFQSRYDTESVSWLMLAEVTMNGDSRFAEVPWVPVADPQKNGSAMTYAKRQALCNLLALTGDDDDDGAAASTPRQAAKAAPQGGVPTEAQVNAIKKMSYALGHRVKDDDGNGTWTESGVALMALYGAKAIGELTAGRDGSASALITDLSKQMDSRKKEE
jgi:hypothetical protein